MKLKITWRRLAIVMTLGITLALYGCNLSPTDQKPYSLSPGNEAPAAADTVTVTYNYGDTGNVQLSATTVNLKVGQKLILQPAAGFSGRTRFVSSGEGYIGNMLQQETNPNPSQQIVFTAMNAGTGKLQIIPNMTETERATDLTVTVR